MNKNLLDDLDARQREAVKAINGPVLILAGAGSGKTRVLTYKVAYLIGRGVDPKKILAATFTNKAASEMRERVIRLLNSSEKISNSPYVGTFHAFCAKLLRIDGANIGISPDYLIYDDDDSLSLIKKIMKDAGIDPKSIRPNSILNAISSAKAELLGTADYTQFARGYFAQNVAKVYEIYQKELKKLGACDFDDLLMQTVKLFKNNPNILAKWARRFEYVLVDEYQDVNAAQYVLTKQLASIHGNLTVVGDASQAIYSFRGADFRNILNFERDFKNAKVFNLEQNYRSTQTILSAANEVIAKNISHPILALWTKNGGGEKISIYNAASEIDEANFIVNVILGNVETPESKIGDSGQARLDSTKRAAKRARMTKRAKFSSFAVLYRTNAQSRTVEDALIFANIPYKLYGGVSFYARKEIKDILAYLRLIANPRDKISRSRVEKLGKRRFEKFGEMVKKLSPPTSPTSLISLIDMVLEATDYLSIIDDGTEQGLMRIENVKELKSLAADFENLTTFLESVTLMEGKVTPEKSYEAAKPNSATLMTIHAAKGLEFDNVFIIGMEEGLFPHSRSMLEPQQIEEERRLAYVALTRAKKKLYLTHAVRRLYFGTQNSNLVSRFVSDIPEALVTAV